MRAVRVFPTGRRATVRGVLRAATAEVAGLRQEARRLGGRVIGLGVGVPGLVDVRRGTVRYLVNLPAWRQVPLGRLLAQATHLPVVVDNDVNAMTWGEFQWGAGRGVSSLVCMTLGTGVGGGLVVNGHLYRGWTMSAGEIGHMPLGLRGPRCACGGRACLERSVGNHAILALARRKLRGGRRSLLTVMVHGDLRRLTPPLLDRAAARGDAVAREVWREVGEQVGVALTAVVNFFNPARIVIGGGIARAGPWLFPTIRATVRGRAMRGPAAVPIVPARWGAEAGLVGAGALVLVPDRIERLISMSDRGSS